MSIPTHIISTDKMGTKSITISGGGYERLTALKGPNESIADVVNGTGYRA